MKKIYYIFCGKYKKLKISYILKITLVLSIICSKCGSKDETIFKKVESIEILKILDLIINKSN